MSTAVYPQGMRSFQSGGWRNATLPGHYISWKGTGPFSNPVGTAPSHIRPLTNLDSGNVFLSGSFPSRTYVHTRVFIPRPLKQYRKGRVIPSAPITPVDPTNNNNVGETKLINYNMNRFVKSSKGTSLGGGLGGRGLLNEMQDNLGSYSIKQNTPTEQNNILESDINCKTCEGVGIVASYYPNTTYLTENPEPNTQTRLLCCNEEYKARRRVVYASTNLKKNYYTTTKQYLQNRCQTFEQKSFNFQQPHPVDVSQELVNSRTRISEIFMAKPGSPLTTFNTYVANCFPNAEIYEATESALLAKLLNLLLLRGILTQTQVNEYEAINAFKFNTLFQFINTLPPETKNASVALFVAFINNPYWGVPFAGPSNPNGCKLTVYKPNNPQYAKQGAVSNSTRLLKLNVDTISTNAASIQNKNNTGLLLLTANELYRGNNNNVTNLLKNKAPTCNSPTIYQYQNKKLCHYKKMLPEYQVPVSQPSPYRYYPATVFRSNHYSQSPNTYNTPSRQY
jgi:hypothetical protein